MTHPFSKHLADFIKGATFEALPWTVVHEVKRLLMDSIGCALVGTLCEKGKIYIELAKRNGGNPEASIIGAKDRVSLGNAALANGEIITALAYDAFQDPPGHFTPYVVSPPLVVSDSVGASGKDLILSTAIGCEIAWRIDRGLIPQSVMAGPAGPKVFPALGYSHFIFGGTAGACRLLRLDPEKIAHALGIAGHLCPVPAGKRFQVDPVNPMPMSKPGSAGWVSMAAVTAALLAQMGHIGDTTLFDGEYGFWRMYAYEKWEPEKALEGLGDKWIFGGVEYKVYPCSRFLHAPLDCLQDVLDKTGLSPAEIEEIVVFGHPAITQPAHQRPLVTHMDAQFNAPYAFACVANRIRPGIDWQIPKNMRDPRILGFMGKIRIKPFPDWEDRIIKEPTSRLSGAVEVRTGGRVIREERMHPRGRAMPGLALSDEELAEKFRDNASRVLAPDKIDVSLSSLSGLESIGNVRDLMNQVTL